MLSHTLLKSAPGQAQLFNMGVFTRSATEKGNLGVLQHVNDNESIG